MKKLLFFLLFCFYITSSNFSQELIPGEIIVWLEKDTDVEKWIFQRSSRQYSSLQIDKKLGIRHDFYLLTYDANTTDAEALLQQLQQQRAVKAVQQNALVTFRQLPNDELITQQWDMELIDAHLAWNITTGGITSQGDTIVVAIMDSGFEISHPDIIGNLWHNRAEILGDNIDNDMNGYIDDDLGWDYFSDTPNIAPGPHGLSTSGIIGASGNNGIGVTGVNWDAQLMQFSFSSVSSLIQAYEYVIDQRMKYNDSNGTEGAFVVATNASFGQRMTFCEEQPAWAAMYDLMGEVGILTASAADNSPYNVDIQGDMPTTCTSDFLITTCNVTSEDELAQSSAYGDVSVDLAAPGEGTFTVKPGQSFGFFGGNSAAAPHVTGAIALMYAAPCENIAKEALTHPQSTALFIRETILANVDENETVQGKTVTGGRLNLKNSLDFLQAQCANETGDLGIVNMFPNPSSVEMTVEYISPDFGEYEAEVFNAVGQLLWRSTFDAPVFGARSFVVPTGHLPAGVYFLRLAKEENAVTASFMVYPE